MTEADARRLLLMRAFETTPGAAWSAADSAAVDREAGGDAAAAPQAMLLRRATLATARLAREPGVQAALAFTGGMPVWLGAAIVLAAFALGFASDALSASGRISLIALALLALLAWNLAVYLALGFNSLRQASGRASAGPLRRAVQRGLQQCLSWAAGRTLGSPALQRFAADWAQASAPLQAARLAALLHAAALAWSLGALASVYLHGIAFEYRAGWDSTFLDAQTVQRMLSFVLWPATALSGMALPAADDLERLRFSIGGGENAARWIHLYALDIALLVLLPRAVLGALAARRARRLSARFELPLASAYFQRLLRAGSGAPASVRLLPYSYRLDDAPRAALARLLEARLGPRLHLRSSEPVAQGSEDDGDHWWPQAEPGETVVLLFSLTATPEDETHGAFVRAVAQRQGEGAQRLVLIDESGFRARFSGTENEARIEQRRAAWRALLGRLGETAEFVDLA